MNCPFAKEAIIFEIQQKTIETLRDIEKEKLFLKSSFLYCDNTGTRAFVIPIICISRKISIN